MSNNMHWTIRFGLAGLLATAVAGCSNGGGKGMSPDPVAMPAIDAFTSTVVTMAKEAPDDTVPIDIDGIAVVLVDDGLAATIN